jgi:hypothetical protein
MKRVMAYPIALEIDYVERHNRLTTLLRWPLAFCYQFLFGFYAFPVLVAVVLGWLSLLFGDRWPARPYRLCIRFLRCWTQLYAYTTLATDRRPSLRGEDEDSHPVRLRVQESRQPYNRLKVACWVFYALPVSLAGFLMLAYAGFAGYASWFMIILTDRQPQALFEATRRGLTYWTRATALAYLLVDRYPPPSADA